MPICMSLRAGGPNGTPSTVNWYARYLEFVLDCVEAEGKPTTERLDLWVFTKRHVWIEPEGTDRQTCWFILPGDMLDIWRELSRPIGPDVQQIVPGMGKPN